tara:strand:+ start:291 stop:2870 length:2580 start_codon:yes stop_codon:yes gene_type:complete
MRRYQLTPYQTVYRDQNSVKINETLRQRFEQAFNADDAIAGAVDQMTVADFEGDQALKMQLENDTRNALQERAARGDYETMGMDVARSARDFQTRYTPLEQNYKKFAAYQEALKELQNSKIGEGGIYDQTAQLALAASMHDYKGLQTNEDGSIDEGSFFNGVNLVGDVDISAEFDKAMQGYNARKGGTETKQLAQTLYDKNGKIIGQPGQWAIKRGTEWEIVPKEDIDVVMQDLLSRPDVQSSLNQFASLRTYNVTDEDIQQQLLAALDGDINDPDNMGGLRGMLQKAISEGKTEEAAALEAQIKRYSEMLEGTGVETPEEMMALRKQFMLQSVKNSEIEREYGAAYAKYVRENVWTNEDITYDDLFVARYKHELESYLPEVMVDSGVTQINNPGGADLKSINAYLESSLLQEDSLLQTINEQLGAERPLTAEDILNGTNIPANANPALVEQYKSQLQSIRIQRHLQEERMADAAAVTGESEEKRQSDMRAVTGAQELFDVITGIMPDTIGNEELQWDILKAYMGGRVANKDTNYESGYGEDGVYRISMDDLKLLASGRNARAHSGSKEDGTFVPGWESVRGFGYSTNWFGLKGPLSIFGPENLADRQFADRDVDDILADMYDVREVSDDLLNAELKKTEKLIAGDMVSTNAPGSTNAEVRANTAAMKNAFVGKVLPENFKIYYDGQVQETANTEGYGTRAALKDVMEIVDTPKVTDIKYPKTTIGGMQVLQFTVEGKNADGQLISKDILVPTSNLEQSGLNVLFTNPLYRVEQELDMHRVHGRPGAILEFLDENGIVTGALEYVFEKEGKATGGIVNILDADGNIISGGTVSMGSNAVAEIIEQNIEDKQTFRTRLPK